MFTRVIHGSRGARLRARYRFGVGVVVPLLMALGFATAPVSSLLGGGSGLAWGYNINGQLGDGTTTDHSTPVPVNLPAGTTLTAVSGGGGHSLALTSAGAVLAWGDNSFGQLGDGTTTNRTTPVPIILPATLPAGTIVTAISAGGLHSLALTSSGLMLAWGKNFSGQLGDGTTTDRSTPGPVNVPAGSPGTVTAISAGNSHSQALTSTGLVLAWGGNADGQLGDGTTTNRTTPVPVSLPLGTTVTAIAAGFYHGLALTSTNSMLAWGLNFNGQLGDGTTTQRTTAVPVNLPVGTTVTAIAAGYYHSLALTSTNSMLAWGLNVAGQLGDGTATQRTTPVPVSLPVGTTVTAISAGGLHSLAITFTRSVLAWGYNFYGGLGDGTTTQRLIPVPVSLAPGVRVTKVAAGNYHSLAITAPPHTPVDFDGDGDTDRAVFRNGAWYAEGQSPVSFGLTGDIPVPGDYDGNGTTDQAVYRNGAWYINGQPTVFLGLAGDIPVPGDYNGNGTTDQAVFRPSTGAWYINGQPTVFLGLSGDIPVPGDYDGNGTTDQAVYRSGAWFINGQPTVYFGLAGDIPVPGDYDANATTDQAVFRNGAWYTNGQATVFFGLNGDIPQPGDYDGNATTDRAVFSNGAWYTNGQTTAFLGLSGDVPLSLPQAIYRVFF